MSPQRSARFAFTRLKLLRGYVKAIRSAKLGWLDRCRCYVALIAYVCQFRKWWRILQTTLRGTGIKCHQSQEPVTRGDSAPPSTTETSHQQAAL